MRKFRSSVVATKFVQPRRERGPSCGFQKLCGQKLRLAICPGCSPNRKHLGESSNLPNPAASTYILDCNRPARPPGRASAYFISAYRSTSRAAEASLHVRIPSPDAFFLSTVPLTISGILSSQEHQYSGVCERRVDPQTRHPHSLFRW